MQSGDDTIRFREFLRKFMKYFQRFFRCSQQTLTAL